MLAKLSRSTDVWQGEKKHTKQKKSVYPALEFFGITAKELCVFFHF